MKVAARARLAIAALLLAACSPDAPPAPSGVGPADAPRAASSAARPRLELTTPPSEVAPPAPAPVPLVAQPTPAPAAPLIGPDIADLGPFEVTTWADARARAEKRITLDNARAELATLRAEIEGRP
jgi:hypothetical protein